MEEEHTYVIIQNAQKKPSNLKELIIVAEDSADRTKLNFEKACSSKQIEFRIYLNIEEISSSIGKQNKAVVGINDINYSNEILKIIDGGEVIG